ncbi:MAG: NAD(P)H-dependent glycerol-3-phosphate dehydrogenase [Pseudomonadota bacterium]
MLPASTSAAGDRIAVLGAGHWGTALAAHLARMGRPVQLWGHSPAPLAAMAASGTLAPVFPQYSLPANVHPNPDLAAALDGSDAVLMAVPSRFFRGVLRQALPYLRPGSIVAWASKGLEEGSSLRLDEVAAEELPAGTAVAVVSGPTFAAEVVQGLPTALTVASPDLDVAERVAGWLRGDAMRAYTSQDVAGVCLGGAIKNVMAIAAGISDGLGYGHNARAALITRGLAELLRLGQALGGQKETFMGLAGAGDLILTCTGDLSRNRTVGMRLGRGESLDAILADLRMEAEGVHTARALYQLAQRRGIDMPIVEQVYRVLYEGLDPRAAQAALMHRQPKREDSGE